MSYKAYLPGTLNAVEWSQAVWRVEGRTVAIGDCKHEMIHSVMLQHLPRHGLIVDAGAGTCKWPIYLRRLGYSVVAIEISHEASVIARENDRELPVVGGDVRHTPLRSESVDAVLSLGVVEHDERGPMDALREAHRILKSSGLLIVSVPLDNLFRRLIVNWLNTYVAWKRRRAGMPLVFNEYRFTRREVVDFLGRAGFEVISVHPNDMAPPRTVGLWVDYNNLVFKPASGSPQNLFELGGIKGRLAAILLQWVPWFVCAEITFVARAI